MIYKKLGDVLKICNGKHYKKFDVGNVPVYGSGGIMTYIDTPIYDQESVLIPRKGSLEKLYYVDVPFWTVDTIFYTKINLEFVIPKFVYYCLQKEHLEDLNQAGGVPSLTKSVLDEVEIPIPPMKIQSEIVRMLDAFTNLISELNAELILRRKQFQYYRDQLLTFDPDVDFVNLGDVCKILRGKRLTTKELIKDGQYPVIHGGTSPMGYYNKSNRKAGTTIVINTGNAGCVFYIDVEFWSSDACFSLYPCEKVLDKFLYFVMSSKENLIKKKIRVAAMPTIDSDSISNLKIPIPPIEQQKKIVTILDKFDKLCNDLTSGIPAEINARKKQYVFYRDKLLTFD